MRKKATILRFSAAVATAAALLGAAACSSGDVSKSDYDKVQQQLQDSQAQVQQLQQQVGAAPKATASATAAAPASSGGVTWLLGAKKVPAATPPPSPSPTAVGATPAPKPTPLASFYDPVQFSVYIETLATTHQSGVDIAATVACTPSGLFVRGQRIVFRYEVIDIATGKRITDKDGAKLKIVLPNGNEANGSFSQRAGGSVPDAPFMWSSNWDIPKDFPLGGIDYKLVITTKDGKAFTWAPPALMSKAANIDTRPIVVGDLQPQ